MKRIFTLTALLCLFMMMGINAAVAQSFSAKWSYGTNGDTTPTISPSGIFESSAPALGSSMDYKNGKPSSALQTLGDIKVWQYSTTVSPADAINNGYTDDRTIKYTLTPKSGTTLTPSQISFYACKIANGDEVRIKVVASVGSKSVTLTNGTSSDDIALDRDNGSNFKYDLGVSGLTVDNSNPLVITVYVKGKGFRAGETDSNGKSISAKNLGFGEVTISGTYKAGSTSIKSSSEMTKSTSVPTTWDFTDKSKWSSTVKALNTYTSEWTATGSNEWRPTTVCNNREYNLELINGLVFNTNVSGDLCLDNSNKQLSVAKGSSITIPGLSSGNYVRFTGSISDITTPENATLISSDGSYLFKINSNGDVKFEIPSTIKKEVWGVWIKSIEVLASAPVNKTTILISDLDIENNKSANYGFDRQVAGFNIDFAGGQGLKSYNDGTNGNGTYIQLRHYTDKDGKTSDGSIKVSAVDPTVKITKLRFNLDNTNGNSADGQLSFDAAGGNIENKIEGDHAQITDLSAQGWSGITLSYIGSDGSKGIHIKSIEIETDKPVSSEAVTPVLSQALQIVDKNGSKTIDGGISSGDNANWLYSGKFTLTSSNTSIATCKGNTINGVGTGTATITVKYTPTNSSYFNAVTSTFSIRVRGDAVKQKVWIFDKTLDGSDGKGIGNGQTFSSDVWTSSTNKDGVTSYSLANATKDDENGANLITADGTTVFRTDGISFICEVPGHLSVVPDNSLTLDGNGTIVLNDIASSVNKGASTYVLIEAEPVSGRAGFIVNSKKWNSNFVNQELTAASNRQTFMLKVTGQKNQQTVDVKIQPSAAMKIYRIEVTQKAIPTIRPTVTGTISTDTKDGTTYQANHGDSFTVTFNIAESDLKGKLQVYAMDNNKIVSGNTEEQNVVSGTAGSAKFDATAVGGGEALFVAKFIPDATETKYTYGYATVSVDVADPTMYRVKNGESANVGEVITSVKGIKMYIDGWEGAPGAPKEYRSDGTADKWGEAKKEAYIETFPGYDYTFSANENSADETLTQYANKFTANYNNDRYWYKENVNNPYSMPVFGGFLKFVPNENGTLKVYIHQNGALCQIRHKDGSRTINPFMVHTRSYYIADETGKLYTDADGVKATTKAKWADVWNGTKIGDGLGKSLGKGSNETKASFDDDDDTDYDAENKQYKEDIAYWRARVEEINGGNSEDNVDENLVQTIYNLDGGWVMLNEGASEYSFHVTAGKTYFVFTNRTKLGFYGFRFTPDKNFTEVTITPSAEGATSYTLTKSPETAGSSVAYKVDQSFKRELKAGMWNTLCLPFSLNEDQTKAALPEGFEIVDFYSVKNDKLTFKKHYYQMIDAGRPYLIWIPGTQGEKYDMKFPTGCVAYDDKTSGSSGLQPINVNGEDDSADKYVWTGTYNQMRLPKNAYFVAQKPDNGKTVIKQNVSGNSMTNGYRAYLVAASGVTPVKALSIDYDGVDEEVTTGIDDIIADLTDPETTGKVYNLGGQLVSRNGLQSLPKGIYIMNGKKYVVK